MAQHEWKFLSGVRNDSLLVLAVCKVCGLMRRTVGVPDRHVDLRGECPGEPQDPGESPPPLVS